MRSRDRWAGTAVLRSRRSATSRSASSRSVARHGFGSETFKRRSKDAGVEPDECYCLGAARPLPDLAIEVVMTSSGIDKLEIYLRLRVPEVWFWIDDRIHAFHLGRAGFKRRDRSKVLPDLDLAALARVVASASPSRQTETVRDFRRSLRKNPRRRR